MFLNEWWVKIPTTPVCSIILCCFNKKTTTHSSPLPWFWSPVQSPFCMTPSILKVSPKIHRAWFYYNYKFNGSILILSWVLQMGNIFKWLHVPQLLSFSKKKMIAIVAVKIWKGIKDNSCFYLDKNSCTELNSCMLSKNWAENSILIRINKAKD